MSEVLVSVRVEKNSLELLNALAWLDGNRAGDQIRAALALYLRGRMTVAEAALAAHTAKWEEICAPLFEKSE